jgi:hypothetical protein
MEDPAWLGHAASEEALWPIQTAAEVDQECAVDILLLFVAVGRWEAGIGGELTVICDVSSIASL